jgi:1-acyl-sn-glycerol-3-phosphate acyltransferase
MAAQLFEPSSEIARSMAEPLPTETTCESGKDCADKPRSIFSYAGFNKLFTGSFLGTLADRLYQMTLVAVANVIFAGKGSENKVVQIQIVATVPGLILYGLVGSLVDTYDRRRLMTLIKGCKILLVLLFIPFIWQVANLDPDAPDASFQNYLISLWPWCLAVVVLLNIITVPFSPARAAAVPDVAPNEHRSLGASLMATTGLISLLLGSFAGSILARTRGNIAIGPVNTIMIASVCYLVATLFLWRLPDAVAIPGNQRGAGPKPAKQSLKEHLHELAEGFGYCTRHLNVLGLIFFETFFWALGSAFYYLLLVHARSTLGLAPNDITLFFGLGLGCVGVGLFGGAIGIGKICNRLSPIASYVPAFLLIAAGLFGVFHAQPVDHHAPLWIYGALFALGLGGGLTLGRVDADVLASTEENIRGRVFSLKALVFAIAVLGTLLLMTEAGLSDPQLRKLALWLPLAVFIILPVVFIFSWSIDRAIWANRQETEPPGPGHRLGYAAARLTCKIFIKILFRYEVRGAEKIPEKGPCILVANHASFLDPLFLGCTTTRIVQYTMYSSYYRSFAHPLFRFLRCIAVDEHSTLSALKANLRSLEQGACIGMFPEGRVSEDGRLQPPQLGAFFLAQRSGVPIIPVALNGNYRAFPRQAKIPRLSKVQAVVLEPFTVGAKLTKEEVGALAAKMMADWGKALEQ